MTIINGLNVSRMDVSRWVLEDPEERGEQAVPEVDSDEEQVGLEVRDQREIEVR